MFLLVFLIALIIPLFALAAIALTFIASWKVHDKAGLPGWSGIVPYYNYYARAERVGIKDTFWKCLKAIGISFAISLVGSFLTTIITGISMAGAGLAASESTGAAVGVMSGAVLLSLLLAGAIAIASFVFTIIAIVQLVKIDIEFVSHFGKSTGFAIGMLLVPYVFYPILAWGNAEWDGDDNIIDIK